MKTTSHGSTPRFLLLTLLATVALASAADGQPIFTKTFTPSTIGPGSTTTLQYVINNSGGGVPAQSLAFTDSLPAGLTLADPASVSTNCLFGTLSAPDGATTISYSGGAVGAGASCTISVNVTATTGGTSTSGDLTSDAGNSGSASATLNVATDRPGFSKSFSPGTVAFGGRSTLTFVIDNTANSSQAFNLSFSDTLPSGMTVADPSNATSTCTGGTLVAAPGTSFTSYSGAGGADASVAAGSSCAISVDVIGGAVGSLDNVSSELTATVGFNFGLSSGKASASLTVTNDQLSLIKSFTDDPVAPGGTVTLEFTLTNLNRSNSATNIAFTDNLDAALSGLAAISLPGSPCNGGSLTGTSGLSFSGGSLGPQASCTFSATLQVPAGAAAGSYVNTTSSVTADLGGRGTTASGATDTLFVEAVPVFTKEFIDDPTTGGGTVTLRFTITNTDPSSAMTGIEFTDDIGGSGLGREGALAGLAANRLVAAGGLEPDPLIDPCGAGSTLTIPDPNDTLPPSFPPLAPDPTLLVFTGGSLAEAGTAGDSCSFDVTLDVPAGVPGGAYLNTTSALTATPAGTSPASDSLIVAAAPVLTKQFIDDPVAAGDTVTVRFTVLNDEEAPFAANDVAFTDDLTATLSGLTAVGLPTDPCGSGSSISGTTNLSLTGGNLALGESCSFNVTLQVPTGALPGSYTNTTSNLMATVSGVAVTGNPAQDDLQVAGLEISKSFTDDPVIAGDTVTLEFTISNTSTLDATNIFFTDSLSSVLSGLTASSLPTDPCGAGSTLAGTSFLIFSGGNLLAGTSCSFSATLQVPASAADGVYPNVTSNLTATVGGSNLVLDPAVDSLAVDSGLLLLSKEFTDDPVAPGGTVTLELTVTNQIPKAVSALAFTDDLDAALSGLVSTSGTVSDVCGAGSQLSGTGLLSFSGGSLAAGASCSFSVTLAVPSGAALGGVFTNTTSDVTGNVIGLPVSGDAASDDLRIDALLFSKSFGSTAEAGDVVSLTFNIQNASATDIVDRIAFTDDLDAVFDGLAAVGLPAFDVCGAGSQISGTSLIAFTGGNLLPGGSCTFNVDVQVPAGAAAGNYVNVTSQLDQNGLRAAGPASATLSVIEVTETCPDPDTIDYGGFTASQCAAAQNAVSVFNQAELDAYMADFGFDGNKVKNVKVLFDPNGDVTIISPCEILLRGDNGSLDVTADKVCAYGRKGVEIGGGSSVAGQQLTAGEVTLVSEEGHAAFFQNLSITADNIAVEALHEARFGNNSDVQVTGAISLVSTGDVASSDALIRQGSVIDTGTLLISASRSAKLGDNTTVTANSIDIQSTGTASGSSANVDQGSQVTTGTLNQTSGNKVRVGNNVDIDVTGNYHLNADGSCSISGSASITAGSTSGNCFP